MKPASFPHALIILTVCVLLAGVLTYLLPAGHYARVTDKVTGRETVVAGSYQRTEAHPVGFASMMLDIPRGLVAAGEIIASILIFGGAFCTIDRTGAFRAGIGWLITRFSHAPSVVLCLIGCAFAIGGALDNMSEEIIALIPVMVYTTSRLGYSRNCAVAISTGCAVIGAAFSPINPFQVGIAEKIGQVALFSGSGFRIAFLVPAIGFWIFWVLRHSALTRESGGSRDAQPEAYATGAPGPARKSNANAEGPTDLVGRQADSAERPAGDLLLMPYHRLILILVALAFALMIYGILRLDWDFNEMSAEFFVLGLVCGFIGKLGANGTAGAFAEGVKEMALAAFIVGMARGVYLVLQDGGIIDTIIYDLFTPLRYLPVFLSALGMMIAHVFIHIPVSSASGQAVLTIPLLSPLADLTGMSRQVMILAYQYGAGLTEMFAPTNGALMGVLLVAGISYKDWWAFVWKPLLVLMGIGVLAIGAAIAVGL